MIWIPKYGTLFGSVGGLRDPITNSNQVSYYFLNRPTTNMTIPYSTTTSRVFNIENNVDISGNINAIKYYGDGSQLTGLSNVSLKNYSDASFGNVDISGLLTIKGDIIPDISNTYDLGSVDKPFRDMYISESTIYMGETLLTIDENDKTFKIKKFRDDWNSKSISNNANNLFNNKNISRNNRSKRDFLRDMRKENIKISEIEEDIFEDDNLRSSKLDLKHPTNNKMVSINPHSSISDNFNLTLPANAGTNGQFLQTNGSGLLTWADAGGNSDFELFKPEYTVTRTERGKYTIVFGTNNRPHATNYSISMNSEIKTDATDTGVGSLDDYMIAYYDKQATGFKIDVKMQDDGGGDGSFRDLRIDFICGSRGRIFCHGCFDRTNNASKDDDLTINW